LAISSVSFKTFPPKKPIFIAEIAEQPYKHYSNEWAAGRYEI
jgi:hypothetical protein